MGNFESCEIVLYPVPSAVPYTISYWLLQFATDYPFEAVIVLTMALFSVGVVIGGVIAFSCIHRGNLLQVLML